MSEQLKDETNVSVEARNSHTIRPQVVYNTATIPIPFFKPGEKTQTIDKRNNEKVPTQCLG